LHPLVITTIKDTAIINTTMVVITTIKDAAIVDTITMTSP